MEAIYGSLMQELDRNTQKRIKSISLMEDAGVKMAEIVMDYCKPKNVLLLLGSGGNAGDALVLGRILLNNNINVSAYLFDEIKNNDAKVNYSLYKGNVLDDISDLSSYDLIIDGIFGIGLKRELSNKLIYSYKWNIQSIKTINENTINTYINNSIKIILIDEAQRIRSTQLNLIIKKSLEQNTPIIFSYDPKQYLSKGENKNIYDILKEYCNASKNPELIKAASSLTDASAKGSGNAFSSSYIPRTWQGKGSLHLV